jgi:protein SCO1/2
MPDMCAHTNMRLVRLWRTLPAWWWLVACLFAWCQPPAARAEAQSNIRDFKVTGVVQEVQPESQLIVIAHEAIANYMSAMTMPFKVKARSELDGLKPGDRISFRLRITENESWIDRISKLGTAAPAPAPGDNAPASTAKPAKPRHPLMDYHFTNELGHAVSLGDFRGQALAITFFFTRCPIPEFCPRLSKNFEAASRKLLATPNAPTNWHFLSVSFDPEVDTPQVLKTYAERYQYDPQHWSFLTGPLDKIRELASQSDVTFQRDGAFYNHNFRTLIIDAAGHLQMVFPMGGDLSEAIVGEIIKAAAVTNSPS